MKKMTRNDFLALFTSVRDPIPGDPNEKTKATKKDHVHKHNQVWLPKGAKITPAEYRRQHLGRKR